jgi:serine phosphatase RsbU (regulator of sigma subunit)
VLYSRADPLSRANTTLGADEMSQIQHPPARSGAGGRPGRLARPFAELAGAASPAVAGGRRTLAGTALGVSMVLISSAGLSTIPLDQLRLGTVGFVFLAAVIASSWAGRLIAGLITSVLAAVTLAYEFVAPIHSLRHLDQTGLVAIVSFVVLALFISWLLARLDAGQQQQRTLVHRIALLQLLTERLSDTVDTGDVAGVVVELCIDELGADAAAVMVVEGDRMLVLADHGFTPDAIEPWREFPLAAETPAGDCVSSGELLTFASSELRDRYPQFDPIEGAIVICVPLIKDGGTLGVLSLRFAGHTSPDASERRLQMAIGAQAAQGMERARLRQSEQRSGRSLALLAAASERLSQTLDREQILNVLAEMVVPDLADHAIVDLVGDAGGIRRLAVVSVEPEVAEGLERFAPTPGGEGPVAVVIREGRPRMFDAMATAVREAATSDEHRRLIERLDGRSAMVVPLKLPGERPIGALTMVSSQRRFDANDLILASDLGRRAATAMEHARLYQEQSTIAQTLQRSLLPARTPAIPGVSVATRYQAVGRGNEVGGDFYDIWEIPGDGFGVAIGDVCGKGPAAAALTSLMRHTVRTASLHEPTPTRVLRVLNDGILRRVDADRFCTVLYAHIVPVDGGHRLRMSAGGHPLPYVIRRDGSVEQVGRPGLLLGVFPQIEVYDCDYTIAPGETVVMFTDGVTEHRGDDGMFGEERLIDVLRRSRSGSAAQIADAIGEAVSGYSERPLLDDIAIVVLGFEATPRPE